MLSLSAYLQTSANTYMDAEGNRCHLAFSARSASLFAISSSNLVALQNNRFEDLDDETLGSLREVKAVVHSDENEFEEVLRVQESANDDPSHRRFVLLPSQWCNLGCSYCGQGHIRQPLSSEHRDAVDMRVREAIKDPEINSVTIGWFGGEPMVGYQAIKRMSKDWIELAKEHNCHYQSSMVTNGSLLNEEKIQCLVNDCLIARFDITIDGTRDVHNQHRPSKSGPGSYNKIIQALEIFRDTDFSHEPVVILRSNLGQGNKDAIADHLDEMSRLGFTSNRFEVNIAPIYEWSNDVSQIELGGKEFADIEAKLMDRMLDIDLNFSVLPDALVGSLCSATSRQAEVVSATGTVFSCTEFPLVERHEKNDGLGSVVNLGLTIRPRADFDSWTQDIREEKYPCAKCQFLPVCGGTCPKQWKAGNRPCPTFKYDIQTRFDILAKMNDLVASDSAKVEF